MLHTFGTHECPFFKLTTLLASAAATTKSVCRTMKVESVEHRQRSQLCVQTLYIRHGVTPNASDNLFRFLRLFHLQFL